MAVQHRSAASAAEHQICKWGTAIFFCLWFPFLLWLILQEDLCGFKIFLRDQCRVVMRNHSAGGDWRFFFRLLFHVPGQFGKTVNVFADIGAVLQDFQDGDEGPVAASIMKRGSHLLSAGDRAGDPFFCKVSSDLIRQDADRCI